MGEGYSAVPTTPSVTYNGVTMTGQVSSSPGYTGFGKIYTLVNPASGANTLTVNMTGGSNGGNHVAVYTIDDVSNTPVDGTVESHLFNGGSPGAFLDTLSITPNSSPTLYIDGFVGTDSGVYSNVYAGQTNNGANSSYKSVVGLFSVSLYGTSNALTQPNIAHPGILIRGNKTFSLSDTINTGNANTTVKGLLTQVADTILMSESYSHIRKVFMTMIDTFKIKNRGWFGKVLLWSNEAKNNSTVTNEPKN